MSVSFPPRQTFYLQECGCVEVYMIYIYLWDTEREGTGQ